MNFFVSLLFPQNGNEFVFYLVWGLLLFLLFLFFSPAKKYEGYVREKNFVPGKPVLMNLRPEAVGNSTPDRFEVWINDRLFFVDVKTFQNLQVGDQVVVVKKPGFSPSIFSV